MLVDQRGTGGSNALNCPEDERSYRAGCRIRRRPAARPAGNAGPHTHDGRLHHLDRRTRSGAVRAALGYQSINLYGVSYGTRVAQQYLRRYPQNVRAVILDGVVPPQMPSAPMALDAQSALQRLFARCTGMRPAARASATPAHLRGPSDALKTNAVPVELPDPGSVANCLFDAPASPRHGGAAGQLFHRASALLPLVLTKPRPPPISYRWRAVPVPRSLLRSHRRGMHNSVVCSEDVPVYGIRLRIARAGADLHGYRTSWMPLSLSAPCGHAVRSTRTSISPARRPGRYCCSRAAMTRSRRPLCAAQAARGLSNSLQVVVNGHEPRTAHAPCAAGYGAVHRAAA